MDPDSPVVDLLLSSPGSRSGELDRIAKSIRPPLATGSCPNILILEGFVVRAVGRSSLSRVEGLGLSVSLDEGRKLLMEAEPFSFLKPSLTPPLTPLKNLLAVEAL